MVNTIFDALNKTLIWIHLLPLALR